MKCKALFTLGLILALSPVAWGASALDFPAKAADFTVTNSASHIVGWAMRESAVVPAVATVILRNGGDTDSGTGGVQCAASGGVAQVGGEALLYIEFATNQSAGTEYADALSAPNGICGDIVAGTVDIVIYVK